MLPFTIPSLTHWGWSSSLSLKFVVIPTGEPSISEKVFPLTTVEISADPSPVVVTTVVTGTSTALSSGIKVIVPVGGGVSAVTVTVIVSVSFIGGVPLSVTRTVIGNEPGPCASVGVQVNAPPVVIAAPAGAPASSEKVRVWPASGSVAVAVKLRSEPSLTVLLPIAASTGAALAWALIAIVIVSVSFSGGDPLSATMTVTGKEPSAGGVQLKAPVELLIVAPAGAPVPSENERVWAGMSPSVAVAVNVPGLPAVPDLGPIGASTGATFTSFTVTVIVSVSFSGGGPLSVTRTAIGDEPGPRPSVGAPANPPPP